MGITRKQRGAAINPEGILANQRPYATDGSIAATFSHTALLTKSSGAGAYTLAAPARDGIVLRLVSRTAQAHVVTATTLIDDGVTGGSKTTLTFAAFPGASAVLESAGGKWNTIALKAVTVA